VPQNICKRHKHFVYYVKNIVQNVKLFPKSNIYEYFK
jgi:hypothetical protein